MAIQFHCPGCSQPIEVDDVHAGQEAACPYCRRVVHVPTESALGEAPPVAARPTAEADGATTPPAADRGAVVTPPPPPQPTPGELHLGPTGSARLRIASRWGTYGLICTVLVLVCFGATIVLFMALLLGEMEGQDTTTPPSASQVAVMQTAAMEKLAEDPRCVALRVGTAFFAVVGLICGIVSVNQVHRNWKGIVSIVLCGMFCLCTCADLMMILGNTFAGGVTTIL